MSVIFRSDADDAVDHALYGHFATIAPGAPGRCPQCDAFGYVDNVDLVRHFQAQRCNECGYRWAYQFDADGTLVEVHELAAATSGRTRRFDAPPLTKLIDLTIDSRESQKQT